MKLSIQRVAFVLLVLMTVVTVLGPLALYLAIAGGRHDGWPPDRPIEWIVLVIVVALGTLLFLSCLIVATRIPHWSGGKPGAGSEPTDQPDGG